MFLGLLEHDRDDARWNKRRERTKRSLICRTSLNDWPKGSKSEIRLSWPGSHLGDTWYETRPIHRGLGSRGHSTIHGTEGRAPPTTNFTQYRPTLVPEATQASTKVARRPGLLIWQCSPGEGFALLSFPVPETKPCRPGAACMQNAGVARRQRPQALATRYASVFYLDPCPVWTNGSRLRISVLNLPKAADSPRQISSSTRYLSLILSARKRLCSEINLTHRCSNVKRNTTILTITFEEH